jgi:hypothetical protein
MQGPKTHDQQVRILERKEGLPKARDRDAGREPVQPAVDGKGTGIGAQHDGVIAATNRESRDHNKHNHSGQPGHGPKKHTPAEEKQ